MKLSELNEWLTLVANFGVLIGLIFLVIELDQSNRIALYSAENSHRNQFIEIGSSRIENPGVMVKLKSLQSELTPEEDIQALFVARHHLDAWIDADAAYQLGLLSENSYELLREDIDVIVSESPGLLPYFQYLYSAHDVQYGETSVSDHILSILEESGFDPKDYGNNP